MLRFFYFSHNLPLFLTALSLLWQTPRLFAVFMKPLPQKYAMGSDWLAGSVCCDSLNRIYCVSECPAPRLSGMCSSCIVNKGVVYIAYQFEPQWDSEDISEEDRAEPVQAWLLMVCLMLLSHTFRYAVIMLLLMSAFNIRFYSD